MEVSIARMRSRHGWNASSRLLREAFNHSVSVSRRGVPVLPVLVPMATAKLPKSKLRRSIMRLSKLVTVSTITSGRDNPQRKNRTNAGEGTCLPCSKNLFRNSGTLGSHPTISLLSCGQESLAPLIPSSTYFPAAGGRHTNCVLINSREQCPDCKLDYTDLARIDAYVAQRDQARVCDSRCVQSRRRRKRQHCDAQIHGEAKHHTT